MRVFLLDLWMDLREKRLAPLAILLLGAIIVVPIVLANGGGDATTPPPSSSTATTAAASPVISEPAPTPAASKLQTFNPRDPFEPTQTVAPTSTSAPGTTSGGSGTSESTSDTTTTTSGGGGGAPASNQPSTTTTPSGTGNTTGETKATLFTYTVDLRFGQSDSVKKYKNVKRLELIPDEDNPKIVFLGVTTSGKTAVFMVGSDTGVDTPGGKCRPSNDECSFLYLRPDADHDLATLTDTNGDVYHLRLSAIHRVTISTSNGSSGGSNRNDSKTESKRAPAFTGRAGNGSRDDASVPGESPPGEPEQQPRFQPFFADSGQ